MNMKNVVTHIRGAWRSWTVWFSTMLLVAPSVVPIMQQNFETLRPFLPDFLKAKGIAALGLISLLLRIKTTASLAVKGSAQPPLPGA